MRSSLPRPRRAPLPGLEHQQVLGVMIGGVAADPAIVLGQYVVGDAFDETQHLLVRSVKVAAYLGERPIAVRGEDVGVDRIVTRDIARNGRNRVWRTSEHADDALLPPGQV